MPNVDFFVVDPGFIVEFDESQHFTEQRMISLKACPSDLQLGYDRQQWTDLCGTLRKKDNDPPFRDEQRAWYDTLRDFAPSILNLKPTVRLFSKDRVWCELHPDDPKDVEYFKNKLSNGWLSANDSKSSRRGLKIGLVSMALNSTDTGSIHDHTKIFLGIVNAHEELDVIAFPGWTLLDKTQLEIVQNGITNKHSLVIFEVWKDHLFDGKLRHKGYFIKDGVLNDRDIIQCFGTSKQIGSDKVLMRTYLDEIKRKRLIRHGDVTICWLICGEINVLRNIQKNSNKVEFRFSEDEGLKQAFQEIYDKTDVFINPTHTIMGNQGKLARRREFLSRNKVFCSVSNADTSRNQKLKHESIQYLYDNERKLVGKLQTENNDRLLFKVYDARA